LKKIFAFGILILLIGFSASGVLGRDVNIKSNSPVTLGGDILYVGGSGANNYTRIQDAIDDASDGDTVFVYSGDYVEDIYIDSSINLIGEDKNLTFIRHSNHDFYDGIIDILSPNVIVSGFTIEPTWGFGSGIIIYSDYCTIFDMVLSTRWGITVLNGNYCEFYRNIVSSSGTGIIISGEKDDSCYNFAHDNIISNAELCGIAVYWQSHNIIDNNYISNCQNNGVIIDGVQQNVFLGADKNIVSNNIIDNISEYGIHLAYNAINTSTTVFGNYITNCLYGILSNAYNQIIYDNTINNNYWGIYACVGITTNPSNYQFYNNTFEDNRYSGISISDGSNNSIYNNRFNSNSEGIELEYAMNTTIYHNEFIDNVYGVWLFESYFIDILNNNFNDNLFHSYFHFGKHRWDGNYWGKPLSHPKIIFGRRGLFLLIGIIPSFQLDWHPASEPYDIGG
jgi:parallel beta-helix repeat protein